MDFKVKCVRIKECPEYFTVGKVYDVVNGVIVSDNDIVFDTWSNPLVCNGYSNTFESLRSWFKRWYDFELVEDKKMFTKSDIKNGDVIVRRNGEVEIAIVDLGVFISPDGWNNYDNILEDLTAEDGWLDDNQWDIVKVIRPKHKRECQFRCPEYKDWGEVVYDRERDTKKPLYNGKVVCVDLCGHNIDTYTVGKIYQFKEGVITSDYGVTFGDNEPFSNFEDWANWTSSKFIEIVE